MSLASAFRAQAGAAVSDARELEPLLVELLERGQRRWPALTLSPESFAAWAGARAPTLDALRALRAEDLYLAAACALGVRGALAAFEAECLEGRALRASLRRIDPSDVFADEVRQVLRERLFVPPPGHIAGYSGRGSLATWTRVTAVRIAMRLRSRRDPPAAAAGDPAAVADPELRFLKRRYGKQFERALADAFARLDHEQHNLLRLQLVDGLGTAEIAQLFELDRSTIKRRLAACREAVFADVQQSLARELGVSPRSFGSLARLLATELELSLSRLLRRRATDG